MLNTNSNQLNSISNQKIITKKFADDNNLHNCKYYVDDGYSGANFNRPGYKQMMDDIYAGKVGTVIVKDQSRLGREYLQTGMLMEITFPQYDVRFIAINDGVDSLYGESDFSGIEPSFIQKVSAAKESARRCLTDICEALIIQKIGFLTLKLRRL